MSGKLQPRIGHRDVKPSNITLVVTVRPRPAARDRLLDLLVELLDNRTESGRR